MTQVHRSVVLLSGGIDSALCLALALADGPCIALTCAYGQAHAVEIRHAEAIARHYRVEHRITHLPLLTGSPLVDGSPIPEGDLDRHGIAPTYVPARNTVLLSYAFALAETADADRVVIGCNADDAEGYPDCRPAYLDAMSIVGSLGLARPVTIYSPLLDLDKTEVVQTAAGANVPLHLTRSCYSPSDSPCGHCDACLLRARAFAAAGYFDLTRRTDALSL